MRVADVLAVRTARPSTVPVVARARRLRRRDARSAPIADRTADRARGRPRSEARPPGRSWRPRCAAGAAALGPALLARGAAQLRPRASVLRLAPAGAVDGTRAACCVPTTTASRCCSAPTAGSPATSPSARSRRSPPRASARARGCETLAAWLRHRGAHRGGRPLRCTSHPQTVRYRLGRAARPVGGRLEDPTPASSSTIAARRRATPDRRRRRDAAQLRGRPTQRIELAASDKRT